MVIRPLSPSSCYCKDTSLLTSSLPGLCHDEPWFMVSWRVPDLCFLQQWLRKPWTPSCITFLPLSGEQISSKEMSLWYQHWLQSPLDSYSVWVSVKWQSDPFYGADKGALLRKNPETSWCGGKKVQGLWRGTDVCITVPLSCVTLGKFLKLSEPHLQNRNEYSYHTEFTTLMYTNYSCNSWCVHHQDWLPFFCMGEIWVLEARGAWVRVHR